MRNTRDTFLHYLADNLPSLTIHAVRFEKDNPGSELLHGNAINVQFTTANFTVIIADQSVTIDVVSDNELTALDWAQQISDLLLATTILEKMDYSSGSPVPAGGYISWNTNVKFRMVAESYFYRYTADLKLSHHH